MLNPDAVENSLPAVLIRAGRDLARPDMLWHALWPPVVSMLLWSYVALGVWAHGMAMITGLLPEWSFTGWDWIAHFTAAFLLIVAFASLVYFTALFLVAVFALPRMMAIIAQRDYPDVQRYGEHPFRDSLLNTLTAGALFLAGSALTMPLLLVPGGVLIVPLLWTAWLNQRTFRIDALVEFARREEIAGITGQARMSLFTAGLICALVAYVPIVHFLAPAYTALVYAHLCLGHLRQWRARHGVTVVSVTT
jgi:CysZ protein